MLTCTSCQKQIKEIEAWGDWDQPFCFDCWGDICREYNTPCYGLFLGGDPNNFTPDMEASEPEERARWSADCDAWGRGERKDRGAGYAGYGLGVNEKGCNLTI